MPIPDKNALPLYGCITGIMLPEPRVKIVDGITLTQGYFEVFSTPMLAFKEAVPGTHTPGPWVAVRGNFNSYFSRAEIAVEHVSALDGFLRRKRHGLLPRFSGFVRSHQYESPQ
jgi:hypothetical protein